MNPNQTERVFELIAEELKEVTAEAFPEQLIAVTKEQMISNFIIGTESTLNRMTAARGLSAFARRGAGNRGSDCKNRGSDGGRCACDGESSARH